MDGVQSVNKNYPIAQNALDKGRPDDAENAVKAVREVADRFCPADSVLGNSASMLELRLMKARHTTEEMLEILNGMIEKAPDSLELMLERGDIELELGDRGYEGTAPSLDGFGRLIRRQKILDASRSILLKNMHGSTTRMSLNKQVATVGKVSFADRNPVLGAIDVTVEDDDLEALIDRVAPMTVDGEEVKP